MERFYRVIRTPFRSTKILMSLILAVSAQSCTSPLDQPSRDVWYSSHHPAQRASLLHDRVGSTTDFTDIKDGLYDQMSVERNTDTSLPLTADLHDYLEYAAIHSPQAESAYYKWIATLEKIPQAGALPDPRLTYGYFIQEIETRVGPQRHRIGLSQMLPWFGKRSLREEIAGQAAMATFENLRGELDKVFYQVKVTYYDLYYLGRSIELSRNKITLLVGVEQVATAKYRVAAGSYPGLIRIQIEIDRLRDQLADMEDRVGAVTARFNATLNRPTDALVPIPTSLPPVESAEWLNTAHINLITNNPMLRSMDHEILRQQTSIELAKMNYYPDFTVGLSTIITSKARNPMMDGSGDDPVLAAVSLNLPIWQEKYDAAVLEAVANRLSTANKRHSMENDLIAQVENDLYLYREADRRIQLYRDSLIPKARQSLEVSITAYQSDSASYLDLLEAERTLLEFELMYERSLVDRAKSIAHLNMLIGLFGDIQQPYEPSRSESGLGSGPTPHPLENGLGEGETMY